MPNSNIPFHAEYLQNLSDWQLFRDILIGGDHFVQEHLKRYPSEEDNDYSCRRAMSTVEGFAASEVIKIRDAIFQRMDAIRRNGGPPAYQKAVSGRLGGVDLRNSTMDFFMGMEVLLELLFLGKVGIFIDSPKLPHIRTLATTKNKHPYFYTYSAEDIIDWDFFLKDDEFQFNYLLLCVRTQDFSNETGLALATTVQYREYQHTAEGPMVRVWDQDFREILVPWTPLTIDRIPFVLLEMERPLLKDIARNQIALLNISSADINFAWRGNVIQYVEEMDMTAEQWHLQSAQNINEPLTEDDLTSEDKAQGGDNPRVIKQGINKGRGIAKGLKYPTFISPPTDPLMASMEKQKQLKDDITRLLNLSVDTARSKFAGAESKEIDQQGLFSGLSAIGLMLEQAERQLGVIWELYQPGTDPISVHYPRRYSLKSDEDRRRDASSLLEISNAISSPKFRKRSQVEIVELLYGGNTPDEELDEILAEVRDTPWPTADPKQIQIDIDTGTVSRKGGSLARGYPAGEAEEAEKEREKRDSSKAAAQGVNLAARGLDDDPEAAREEKEESQSAENNDGVKRVRGEANGPS